MINDKTLHIGTKVAYVADERVRGIVVGHGTVDNGADALVDGGACHHVVIVRVDEGHTAVVIDDNEIPASMGFHAPFVPSRLKVL